MSNNTKKQQYIVKGPQTEQNSNVPPQYQPPPHPQNPGGILKHPVIPKDAKYPMKQPYPPHFQHKPQIPYHYPQVGVPQGRVPNRTIEEVQIHHRLDEAGIPQQNRTARYTEEEFLRPNVEMLKFVRKTDQDTTRIVNDQTRHMQGLVVELREANQRLADDNQELRDLCCFLDDDRQKGRKLAREWQRFGRYTATVMRQEVSAYQHKLRELDNKQQELIKDNLELKELCLYLDEERGGNSICPNCGTASTTNLRDDGDGSSSSTNADEPAVPQQFNTGTNAPRRTASRERLLHENLARQRSTFNDQIMQYVRNLEQRVQQLEDDKRTLTHKINQLAVSTGDPTISIPQDSGVGVLSGRPEAVVRALQVLEVREQLEREGRMPERGENMSDTTTGDMDDGEKALVREMCNVVWRKLEEGPESRR